MSKQTNNYQNIDKALNNANLKITNLKTSNNIDVIVKDRKELNEDLKAIKLQIDQLYKLLETPMNLAENETDIDFNKYYTEIEENYKNFWKEDCSIDKQIELYHKIKNKIDMCVKYLEDKKLEMAIID